MEHSVIISFNYGLDDLEPLFALEDELIDILAKNNVGECDGHEIAMDMSDGQLFLYGSNAETLFKTIKPALDATQFLKGAIATLRFGSEDDAKEIDVVIGDN